jgi:hypothetical protein
MAAPSNTPTARRSSGSATPSWLLPQKLNREQITTYFENRRAKGFNVVQCCVVQFFRDKSFNGSPALVDEDYHAPELHPGQRPGRSRAIRLLGSRRLPRRHRRGQRHLRRDRAGLSHMWRYPKKPAPAQAAVFPAALPPATQGAPIVIWLNGGSGRGGETDVLARRRDARLQAARARQFVTFHPFRPHPVTS